ncbi:MAG: class I SAM-dependent methyltransferase [Thermoplasmata archaeon]
MGSGTSAARTTRLIRTFDRSAALYERGRPGYPPAAVRFLGRTFHLGPGSTIVELGSGTGKFTRALLPLGATLVAVEPMAGMRREFRRRVPTVPVLEGSAEAIPLPDGFADAVFAAQSFHWFRGMTALREIARVLRPGGGLGLVWNAREERAGWAREFDQLLNRHGGHGPSRRGGWRAPFGRSTSPFRALHHRKFPYAQTAPAATYPAWALSVSRIQALPPATRRKVAREVRALLSTHPSTRGRAVVKLPYRTSVYYTSLRGSPRRSPR